jgi:hypothetical protein
MSTNDCLSRRQDYSGKFRAKVISTEDVTMSGKLLCEVAALPGMNLNWATPSVPYAGIEQGMFALPEEGADVWIEFEGEDPDNPVWSGGYWEEDLEPLMPEIAPEEPELVNVFRSKFCTLLMNDTPAEGGITLSVLDPAAELPVTFAMNSLGVEITVGELSLTMNPEVGITLTAGESVITLTPETATTEAPTIDMTAEAEVNITAPETSVEGNFSVTGEAEVEGATTLVGEASVGGDLNVAGAVEVEGEANFLGATSTEGEANFAGALTTEGEANFLGELSVEGDANFLGAQQTEGNNAVLGIIEGIVVPPGL